MENCIFCKIVNKEVPNYTVYEDDFVLAFLDIFPHSKGHTVIIPKKHFVDLSAMTEEEWQKMAVALKRVEEKLQTVLQPAGFNIGINDQPAGGQVVPHVHWHIFPRWEKDGGGSVHSIIKNPGELKVEEVWKLFGKSS
ncbi:MAG: Histidine triad (HIT) protein [Candidatus Magasanikbacteria bacterium GW2011_GWC2_37_14]|uniref:Histidine triad (HIT) protein n=1 Tax=Candidatus Magasanikbacteria bacterium GW2011_GWC2_37_14 TaxID=1619046 RepID=A0A0G0G861_9BACT|nr:MAG: Histidine triad (HIT) protein [Candidatus Magasanikbacteria bacterium GW2011_GWC2_37_14]